MRIKKTTVEIEQEPNGHIQIKLAVHQKDGQSKCAKTIKEYPCGCEIEEIAGNIYEILSEYKKDGTLEE